MRYFIQKRPSGFTAITDKMKRVMKSFGVEKAMLAKRTISHDVTIFLEDGDICMLTGPSGSGKSTMLTDFYNQSLTSHRMRLEDVEIETEKSVIDCIKGDFFESLKILSKAGLSDVYAVLNTPENLSDGQKYRYQLAQCLLSDKHYIIADNFCDNLDRISAMVISHNLRKIAERTKKTFILASCNDDILSDLQPDVIIICHLNDKKEVIFRDKTRKTE